MFFDFDGFDWDEGNSTKNWKKHQVTKSECEQAFFNKPTVLYPSKNINYYESRFVLLSETDQDRLLTIIFTVRDKKIRVISARDMSRKERGVYDKKNSEI